jgi:hypothetical protein
MPPQTNGRASRRTNEQRRTNERRRRSTRRVPVATQNALYFPGIAKTYATEIDNLRGRLREIRRGYKLAIVRKNAREIVQRKNEFDQLTQTDWPFFIGYDRTTERPYSTVAKPYPSDQVLALTTLKQRWRIIATALLAYRGVDQKRHLDELVPKINGALNLSEFKVLLKKYISPPTYENPPAYPFPGENEDGDADNAAWDQAVNSYVVQPVAPYIPYPVRQQTYGNRAPPDPAWLMPPEGSPGRVSPPGPRSRSRSSTTTLPHYPEIDMDNYPLEEGGRRTRSTGRPRTKGRTRTKGRRRL